MNFSSSAEKERHIGQELEEMIGSHADLVSCFFCFSQTEEMWAYLDVVGKEPIDMEFAQEK